MDATLYSLCLKAFTWHRTVPAMSVRTLRETVGVVGGEDGRREERRGRESRREGKGRGQSFFIMKWLLQ